MTAARHDAGDAGGPFLCLATAAMGTRFEIVLHGHDERLLRAAGETALEEIRRCDRALSWFRRDSVVSRINRHASAGPVAVDDETMDLLLCCRDVHARSGGAFDVTVAPLMTALGFRDVSGADARGGHPPAWGMAHVELDARRRTVRFARPGMAIDLGAIGKGHALDRAAEQLGDDGVTTALLHGGTSTVVALGAPPGERGWRVAVRDPRAPATKRGPGPTVLLNDAALSVSAPHGRVVERDGETIGHVLDPRTGRATSGAGFAAVAGPSARLADAWSTALLVLDGRPRLLHDGLTTLLPGRSGRGYRLAGQRVGCFSDCQA